MVSFLCLHLSPFCRYLSPHLHSIICSAPLFVSQSTSRSPRLPTCPLQFPIAVQSCPFSPASVPTPPLSPCSSLSGLLYSSQFCSLCPASFNPSLSFPLFDLPSSSVSVYLELPDPPAFCFSSFCIISIPLFLQLPPFFSRHLSLLLWLLLLLLSCSHSLILLICPHPLLSTHLPSLPYSVNIHIWVGQKVHSGCCIVAYDNLKQTLANPVFLTFPLFSTPPSLCLLLLLLTLPLFSISFFPFISSLSALLFPHALCPLFLSTHTLKLLPYSLSFPKVLW